MKFLCRLLCLSLVFCAGVSFATPSCGRIQLNVRKAHQLWSKDPVKAQNKLNVAFNDAINWTRNEYVRSVREKGFYLAVQCLSPELITEVSLAADTYLKLFPKGIYRRSVLVRKALASFQENDWNSAEIALRHAEKLSGTRTTYAQRTLRFSGLVGAGKHRSAEKYIEGSYLRRPSYKLKKDLRKFHLGNRYVESVLNKVKSGKISLDKSVKLIEEALDYAAFAKKAPAASLIATNLKDSKSPYFHPKELTWCWKKRENLHSLPPQIRLARHQKFLSTFREAKASQRYGVLQKVRNIYLYEMNEPEKAEIVLNEMKSMKGYRTLSRLEEIVSRMSGKRAITFTGRKENQELVQYAKYFPYDNGALPVISLSDVEYLLILGDMVKGGKMTLNRAPKVDCYAGLPLEFFYKGALDRKADAWGIYTSFQGALTAPEKRMIKDCLYPLYLYTGNGERLFFAGLAAMTRFPYLAIDLIHESLSIKKRLVKNEHGFAILSALYRDHMAYEEAQEVWSMLRTLHPDSIWLK